MGIIITICYVNWVVREHDRQKWQPIEIRIANRLRILLNSTVSSIRAGLGYGPEILNERVLASQDEMAWHKEVIRVGEHVIAPSIHHRIRSLDADGWKSLARQIRHVHSGVALFFNTFQGRLNSVQMSHLLDIENGLSRSLTSYSVFPDVMGVPKDQLPAAKTTSEEIQQSGCESTANELHKVLLLAKKLSETLHESDP